MSSFLFSSLECFQLLILLFFSISLSLLGTFLYLRKQSMMANAISHTILFGVAIVFIAVKYLYPDVHFFTISSSRNFYALSGIITAVFTLGCIEGLKKYALLKDDASMAFVFSTLFSLGVIIITLVTQSAHVGVDLVVGNLDLADFDDTKMAFISFTLTAAFCYVFFPFLKALSFDERLVYFSHKKGAVLQVAFLFLMSFVITCSFRFIGIAPALGLIILPPITASFFCTSVKKMIEFTVYSNISISLVCFLLVKYVYETYGVSVSSSGVLICLHYCVFIYFFRKNLMEKTAK